MKAALVLLGILTWADLALASVTFSDTDERLFFSDQVEYYEDETASLSIPSLTTQALEWKRPVTKNMVFGFTSSVIWLRFELENQTAQPLYLTFNGFNVDSIEIYIEKTAGGFTKKSGGSTFPFAAREIHDKDLFFVIPENEIKTAIYARI